METSFQTPFKLGIHDEFDLDSVDDVDYDRDKIMAMLEQASLNRLAAEGPVAFTCECLQFGRSGKLTSCTNGRPCIKSKAVDDILKSR